MDVFGSSGIRGITSEELAPADVLTVAQAAGDVFETDRVAIGQDTRRTGQLFVEAAASGLASVGCAVDRVGIVPTPSLQAYCERVGVPGVMITASHNPPEYNGVKLCGSDGVELTSDTLEQIERRLGEQQTLARWDETGTITDIDGANRDYREQLLDAVDRDRIADADLTVAIDPGHGAGSLTSPTLFRELGCRVITVNAQPDGHFPGRRPEPVEDNLSDLGRLVRSSEADIGIAHDGDADRAIFFDERGEFVEGDAALAALAAEELSEDDVAVSAVNASQRLVDVADDAGAALRMTPIGSTHLITEIRDRQAEGRSVPIAGEGNGGIIFPTYRIARDGAYTAARFCELLTDQPASELVAAYDDYDNVRRNVEYASESEREAMIRAIEQTAGDATATLDQTDGYRLNFDDGWVLARPSGTEPVIRVYAEARESARVNDLASLMVDAIEDAKADA
jgi:phosphomannomutase/phosphoglucomutase